MEERLSADTPAPAVIPVTVGRIVWYYPSEDEDILLNDAGQPLAAIVVRVFSDTSVNLAVYDIVGQVHGRKHVVFVQPNMEAPEAGGYCTWMPYQIGQAAKYEAMKQQVEAKKSPG